MTLIQRRASFWPALQPRHVKLLGLLAAASFFAGYDANVILVILPQVRHAFGLSQAQASDWFALLFAASLFVLVALQGVVTSDPFDGLARGVLEACACLLGFAALGPYVGLWSLRAPA